MSSAALDKLAELMQKAYPELKVVNAEGFLPTLRQREYTLVDFWAPSCVPCLAIVPTLNWIQENYGKRGLQVVRINIDEGNNSVVAKHFKVTAIPHFKLFKRLDDGEVGLVETVRGANEEKLKQIVAQHLGVVDAEIMLGHKVFLPEVDVSTEQFIQMQHFAEKVALAKGWKLNPDKQVRNLLIEGLAKNKLEHKYPYCPCKREHIPQNICPCRETLDYLGAEKRIRKEGCCYCGLFVAGST